MQPPATPPSLVSWPARDVAVTGMATETLRGLVAEGAAHVPAHIHAMWAEELSTREAGRGV